MIWALDALGALLVFGGFWIASGGRRWGWWPYMAGELVYSGYAYLTEAWGLLALCLAFTVAGARAWRRHPRS